MHCSSDVVVCADLLVYHFLDSPYRSVDPVECLGVSIGC